MTGDDQENVVWIRTVPSPDGTTYMVTVEFSDDRSIPLTQDTAPRYAMTILGAVARARYDAAVYHQMTELTDDMRAVGHLIQTLRLDRPPIDYSATKPLTLDPGVNAQGEPFLHVLIDDELVGQWTMQGALDHVCMALQVTAVADLDAGYYRALITTAKLEPELARQVVDDLSNHRLEERP